MEVQIGQSQVGSKTGKQSVKADNSKCHHQHTEKRVEPAKVNPGQQYSDQTKRAYVRTADDANPGRSDYDTCCLVQRKLSQIEIFPWNVSVSGHGGACADMPDHLTGGQVHWEYRDPREPERDATAQHQGPGYAPDVCEASVETQPRNTCRKQNQAC